MNYFLENRIPSAMADIAQRYAEGGEVERDFIPRSEDDPVTLEELVATPEGPMYDEKGNLLPSADSPLTKMSGGVPRWAKMMELYGATPTLIRDLTTPGTGGKDISVGDLYKTKREQAVKAYEDRLQRFKDAGEWSAEVEANLKSGLDNTLASLTQEETGYLNSLPQRQVLSDLLKANKFTEAYKYAQDNGMQTLLLQTDQLRNLRDPFTKDEAQQFIRSMPYEFIKSAYGDRYEFEDAFKFDPEGAESRGALSWIAMDQNGRPMASEPGKAVMSETGYPSLDAVLKPQELKKKDGTFEKIFKAAAIVAAIYGGAQLVGALKGASAAKAIGATAAKTAGATAAGTTAATAAPVVAGTTATSAALSPLQTITVLGSKAAGAGLTGGQIAGLAGGAAAAGSQIAGGAGAGGGGAAAGAEAPIDPSLEEILVRAKPVAQYDPSTLLASTSLIQGTPDTPVDIYGRPVDPMTGEVQPDVTEGKIDAVDQPPPDYIPPLDEVLVYGSKPAYLDLLKLGTIPALSQMLPQGSFGQPTTVQDATQVAEETGDMAEDLANTEPEQSVIDKLKGMYDKYGKYIGPASSLISGVAGALTKPQDLSGGRGVGATYDPRTAAGGIGGRVGNWIDWEKVKQDAAAAGMSLTEYTAQNLNKVMNRDFEAGLAQPTAPSYNPEDTGMATGGRLMRGGGHGRDDLIPARLSDGEYVIDAETVSLIGNGSSKAGGLALDEMRREIRRHKGRSLAKGKFSPNAKSPLAYLKGK